MPLGRAAPRIVDQRLAAFSAARGDLLGLSPVYCGWRERILGEGAPSRAGQRLELTDGVYAELSAFLDGSQPVSFGSTRIPATRVRLFPAEDPDPDRPLAHDTCEHYRLSFPHGDAKEVAAILNAVGVLPATVTAHTLRVLIPAGGGGTLAVEPRRVGIMREARFTTEGYPLDVLKVARAAHEYSLGAQVIALTDLPHGAENAAPYVKRLTFLSAPAARQMMTMLLHGQLVGGDLDQDMLDASYVATSFDPPSTCRLCSQEFRPRWLPHERGSTHPRWQVCPTCMEAMYKDGVPVRGTASLEELAELVRLLGHVPSANWRESIEDETDDFDRYIPLVRQSWRVAPSTRYTFEYGSWFQALVASGVLAVGDERRTIGYRTIAADGHLCLSLGERTIDDWLHAHKVAHTREPSYPNSRYRADWLVNGRLVEYFGLAGVPEYDAKSAAKRVVAGAAGMPLVEITPVDLADWEASQVRVATELGVWLSD